MKRLALLIALLCAGCGTGPTVAGTSSGSGGAGGGHAAPCFVNADCPASLAGPCQTVHCDPTGKNTAPESPVLGCYLLTDSTCDGGTDSGLPFCLPSHCPPPPDVDCAHAICATDTTCGTAPALAGNPCGKGGFCDGKGSCSVCDGQPSGAPCTGPNGCTGTCFPPSGTTPGHCGCP